ncbi:hypothetical protein NS355_11585 [Sphingomonas yabuuchiae]|uniref:BD-FAE-like domain-containing protein n=1 Tax=Sphingomonas yabuuchiae TaxID=172044 RepID=A0A147IQF4_9SPHN|nr:alpha/beta hydrolase [Sphingomonas yabuuchiae]KTT97472.1 hypothetical protein NS355_11585 [Sphingomonas yabuuchiae]
MVSDTPPTHTHDRATAGTLTITTDRPRIDEVGEVIYYQVKRIDAVRGLRMTLLVPRTSDPKPAILYVPGGGFTSAAHRKFIEMRLALAQAGFVVAAAEYRVVPDVFPAPLEDGKAAVRYLRAHAEDYGIDPDRIGVLGDSAGGWLAQMLAMTGDTSDYDRGDWRDTSSAVQAAVSLYGISDLRNIGAGFSDAIGRVHASTASTEALLVHGVAFGDFAGATINSDPAKALAASPIGHLSGQKPPLLLMHGSADDLVSPVQSEQMAAALRERDADVDHVVVDGAGHGDGPWFQPALIEYVVAWFGKTLIKR